jgi:hypothetical protein
LESLESLSRDVSEWMTLSEKQDMKDFIHQVTIK